MSAPTPGSEQLREKYRSSGLGYHIDYLCQAESDIGIAGRTVLEVGGSLPSELVLNDFRAKRWIAIQEPEYYRELGSEFDARGVQAVPIESVRSLDDLDRYAILIGRVEQLGAVFHDQFDLVFSIAAFEHINRLGVALERMRLAMHPRRGALFAMFSPVWSAHDGHHLPDIVDSTGRRFNSGNHSIPPWGHLLMRPPEMFRLLCGLTDIETADEVCYYMYHSPHINRLFTEDYNALISPDFDGVFQASFCSEIPPEIQSRLEALHPGRTHFANNGIKLVLRRKR